MAGRRRKQTFWNTTPHSWAGEGKVCQLCERGPGDPLHLLVIPGLEAVAEARLNVHAAGFQPSLFDQQ